MLRLKSKFQNPNFKQLFNLQSSTFKFFVLFIFFISQYLYISISPAFSQEAVQLQDDIQKYTREISRLQGEERNLSEQISLMDKQIKLTTLKISQAQGTITQTEKDLEKLEEDIDVLSGKIDRLSDSLAMISGILQNRIRQTYKKAQISEVELLLSSQGFSDLLSRTKYLQVIQQHDKKLLYQMQATRQNYQGQKGVLEEKQEEKEILKAKLEGEKKSLLAQQTTLSQQKRDKDLLLDVTRNEEKRYQELLAKARSEYAAIQAVMARAGEFKNGVPIKKGDIVAVMGNSGYPSCSTGAHLHFEVQKDGGVQNPANYLKDISLPDDHYEKYAEKMTFTGSWDWPLESPMISQEYGMTYWARLGFYNGNPHTGIDMYNNSNSIIKAVADGTLYSGSTTCSGRGTSSQVNYSAIDHGGGLWTWYWHIR